MTGGTDALARWIDPFLMRVRGPELAWILERASLDPQAPQEAAAAMVRVALAAQSIRRRYKDRADTLRATAMGLHAVELHEVLARHIRVTVPEGPRQRQDLSALDRDLDLDALLEREALEQEFLSAVLELCAAALRGLFEGELAGDLAAFEASGAEPLLVGMVSAEPWLPARRQAARSLATIAGQLLSRGAAVRPELLQLLRRTMLAPDENPWIRRHATEVARGLDAEAGLVWLGAALGLTEGGDSFLVRARAMELLFERTHAGVFELAQRHVEDPSELVQFVRIGGLAARGSEREGLQGLREALGSARPRCRAMATSQALGVVEHLWEEVAARVSDPDPFVVPFALDLIDRALRQGHEFPPPVAAALALRARSSDRPDLAQQAAQVLALDRALRSPLWAEAQRLGALRQHESVEVQLPTGSSTQDLARALVPWANGGFGFHLEPLSSGHIRVQRADTLRFRLWRFLYEMAHPGPSKRQGFDHDIGRVDRGPVRVPPVRMAEQAPTGIPGERLTIDRIGGWGTTVPMVDDYLDALKRPIQVVAAEGTTDVRGPDSWWKRAVAWARLTFRFAHYDFARNAALAEDDPERRPRYVRELAGLGFHTHHEPRDPGSNVQGYFRSIDPLTYLVTLSANSLGHLALTLGLLALAVFGRTTWAKHRVTRARRGIPLVIGGWGTRGKSGTERLKAGLFQGLGVPVFSKTTGCEAMILHAPPLGRAMELFLFRPFDKATIWEQIHVVTLAKPLGARVFLYECMALNPKYVDMIQRGWMRDDVSTLTNAYPDHEDVQGPTGLDVATVISGFSPLNRLVFTTEDAMFPILREGATTMGSQIRQVPRHQRDLVPTDLMERMPHAEHPHNVALVAAVAEHLGLERTEAIGAMAENVVPDLGALIIYPEVPHLRRKLTFVNGMSANDFLSWRNNWRRAGFEAHDHRRNPTEWLVTVTNNRADRVPRSRVFAGIIANQAAAHRHVSIGTNLSGLDQYTKAAVDDRLAAINVGGDVAKVDALFHHLRIVEPRALGSGCAQNLGAPPEAIAAWEAAVATWPSCKPSWDDALRAAESARPAAQALEQACPDGEGLAEHLVQAVAREIAWQAARGAPDAEAKQVFRDILAASLNPIWDAGSTGDQIIGTIAGVAPPGTKIRILGQQNIKGTGLDFAYQWVFWRELHAALQRLRKSDPAEREAALAAIESNPFGAIHSCEAALGALEPLADDPDLKVRIQALLAKIRAKRESLDTARRVGAPKKAWYAPLLRYLEQVLDPFDSIWRRQRADQVFDDLQHLRISHVKAQAILQMLTKRQKGGWLGK